MSSIKAFYQDKTLFLTGATGFLGQPLVGKILRDLPHIRRLYLLVRPKTNLDGTEVSAEERLQKEVFGSTAFRRLRQELGNTRFHQLIQEKVVAVPGDLALENLGLTPDWLEKLTREVDVVINSAAVVNFDEPLDSALTLNALGPARVAQLSQLCSKAVLLHVSTCYVCGRRRGLVPEKPLEAVFSSPSPRLPKDPEEILSVMQAKIEEIRQKSRSPEKEAEFLALAKREIPFRESATQEQLKAQARLIQQRWLREELVREGMRWAQQYGWNDTYTFTKALGEALLLRHRGSLPTIILRPSIIESSLQEPEPGWLDGFRMADPIIIAYGKGRLSDFPADPNIVIDLIPVDYVVNAILAAIPQAAQEGLKVYQVATGTITPLVFKELVRITREYFLQHPLTNRQGEPVLVKDWTYPSNRRFALTHGLIFRPLLRKIRDFLEICRWFPKLRLKLDVSLAAMDRLAYYVEIYSPYTHLDARFETSHTQALYEALSEEDKSTFFFDLRQINWQHYIQEVHVPGLLRHVLKMDPSTALSPGTPSRKGRRGQRVLVVPKPSSLSSLPQLLLHSAEKRPQKIALQRKQEGRWVRYTYEQVKDLSLRMATRLRRLGITFGDRVILYAENCPEWGIAYFACAHLGATVVPLDPQWPPEDLKSAVKFVSAKAILATESRFASLKGSDLTKDLLLLNIQQWGLPFGSETLSLPPPDPDLPDARIHQETPASMIFTSGPYGNPRVAVLTHGNFLANVQGIAQVLRPLETDQFLSILPLYHAFEFTGGFLMPIFGTATITYPSALNSKALLEGMRETGTTCVLAVPRFYSLIYENIEREVRRRGPLAFFAFRACHWISYWVERVTGKNLGRRLFSRIHRAFGGRIRVMVSGGASLDLSLYDAFHRMGFPICVGYGLTEASPVLTVNPLERRKRGSVGLPLPGVEIRISGADERGIGEVWARGPNIMQEYFRNPEATAKVLREGWLHTGDLGWQDPEGYLYLTGRIKEMILSSAGKNVYPEEVEARYRNLRGIRDLCVIGYRVPGKMGEEVHAVVIPDPQVFSPKEKPEVVRNTLLREIQTVSASVPSYQRIQKLHLWPEPEFPKTPALATDRTAVRKVIEEGLELDTQSLQRREPSPVKGVESSEILSLLAQFAGTPAEEILPEHHLRFDLGLDSLQVMEVIAHLEEQIGIELPEEIVVRLHTVQDVLEAFREKRISEGRESPSQKVVPDLPCLPPDPFWGPFARRLLRFWGRLFYRLYLRLEVRGQENLPDQGPLIIVANHTSHLDTGAVICALGEKVESLCPVGAKDYFFNHRLKGFLLQTLVHVVPFDRHGNFIEGFRVCRQVLDQGKFLLIYPEGTRSLDGQIAPFRPGVGHIAVETRAPILPCLIEGAYESMPKGRIFPKPGRIRVTFGRPIPVEVLLNQYPGLKGYALYRALADAIQQAVQSLKQRDLCEG